MIKNKLIAFVKKLAFSLTVALFACSCENFTDEAGAFLESYGNIASIASIQYSREGVMSEGQLNIDSSSDFAINFTIDNPGNFTLAVNDGDTHISAVSKNLVTIFYSASDLAALEIAGGKFNSGFSLYGITPSGKTLLQCVYPGEDIVCNSAPSKITNALGQLQTDTASSINERLVIALQLPPAPTQGIMDWKSLCVTDTRSGAVHEFAFSPARSTTIPDGTVSNGWTVTAVEPTGLGPSYPGGRAFTPEATGGVVYYVVTDVDNAAGLEPFDIILSIKDQGGLENPTTIPSHEVKLDTPTCSVTVARVENTYAVPYYDVVIHAPANAPDATLHYAITDSSGNSIADISGSATEHVGDTTFRLYPKADGSDENYLVSQVYATKSGYADSDDGAPNCGSAGNIAVGGITLEEPTASIATGSTVPQGTELVLTAPQDGASVYWMYSLNVSSLVEGDEPSPAKVALEAAGSYIVKAYAHKTYYINSPITSGWNYTVTLAKVYIKRDIAPGSGTGTYEDPLSSIDEAIAWLGNYGDPSSSANTICVLGDMQSINGHSSISSGYYNIVGCAEDGTPGVPVKLKTSSGEGLLEIVGGTVSLRAVTLTGMDGASSGAIGYIGGKLMLKDKVTITGNANSGAAKNINIATAGLKIYVDAGGLAGTKVGVTTVETPAGGTPVTITDGYADACGTEPLANHFTSDSSSYAFVFDASGEAALAAGGGSIDIGDIYSVSFAQTASAGVYTFTASATPTSGGSPVDITADISTWSMKLYYLNTYTGMSAATNTMDLSALGAGTYIMKISAAYGGKTYSGEVELTIDP